MIDLRCISNRDCYPICFPSRYGTEAEKEKWRKTAIVFQFRSSSYIVWSIAEHRVLVERCFKFTLKKAIKELEAQGWIVELGNRSIGGY